MDFARLQALGFESVCGQIDRRGTNYGRVVGGECVLTPEGDALVAELEAVTDVPFREVKPKHVAAKHVAAKHVAAHDESENGALAAELNSLTGS